MLIGLANLPVRTTVIAENGNEDYLTGSTYVRLGQDRPGQFREISGVWQWDDTPYAGRAIYNSDYLMWDYTRSHVSYWNTPLTDRGNYGHNGDYRIRLAPGNVVGYGFGYGGRYDAHDVPADVTENPPVMVHRDELPNSLVFFRHGIAAHANTLLTFDLTDPKLDIAGSVWREFSAVVGINIRRGGDMFRDSVGASFTVLIDGEVAYYTGRVDWQYSVPIRVPIPQGAQTLQLVAERRSQSNGWWDGNLLGNDAASCHVAWGDAKITMFDEVQEAPEFDFAADWGVTRRQSEFIEFVSDTSVRVTASGHQNILTRSQSNNIIWMEAGTEDFSAHVRVSGGLLYDRSRAMLAAYRVEYAPYSLAPRGGFHFRRYTHNENILAAVIRHQYRWRRMYEGSYTAGDGSANHIMGARAPHVIGGDRIGPVSQARRDMRRMDDAWLRLDRVNETTYRMYFSYSASAPAYDAVGHDADIEWVYLHSQVISQLDGNVRVGLFTGRYGNRYPGYASRENPEEVRAPNDFGVTFSDFTFNGEVVPFRATAEQAQERLGERIAEAQSLLNDLTVISRTAMEAAIASVQSVYNTGAWQMQFNNAVRAINVALNNRVYETPDLTDLIEEVQRIEEAITDEEVYVWCDEEGDYVLKPFTYNMFTSASWKVLIDALYDANAVIDGNPTRQSQVNYALAVLNDAWEALTLRLTADDLNALIATAQEAVELNYSPASWSVLQAAISDAAAVAGDSNATEQDIDNAFLALEEALENLVTRREALTAGIAAVVAENLVETNFTPATWTPFNTALTNAINTRDNAGATPAELLNTLNALNDARLALTARADFAPITGLIAAIERENLVEANFTAATWTALQNALTAAGELDYNATSEQIANAVNNLTNARAGLVEADTESPPVNEPGGCGNGNIAAAMFGLIALAGAGLFFVKKRG